ncbi:aspartyl protease family protein [bacterium]|nr:aspartyl protease family protein [bacterium]
MKRTIVFAALCLFVLAATAGAQNVYGEMPLIEEDGYLLAKTTMPDGSSACFAVDLAVNTTAVSRAFVADTKIEQLQGNADPLAAPRYHTALGGFGLSKEIVGRTHIASLSVGGLQFADAAVVVLEDMPNIGGRTIAGVLGTDMLRRAEIAQFSFGDNPTLMLKSRARKSVPDAIEMPMNVVGGYIMVAGKLHGHKADFLFDTGSPVSYIPLKTVRAAGATAVPGSNRSITTLDGNTVTVREAEPLTITLGDREFEETPLHIGELPVFKTLPESTTAVLLGNDFFARMQSVQFNFTDGSLRMIEQ